MYGGILLEGEGEEGGLYLITLFFCWIAPSYLQRKWQVGKEQSCQGNIFLKEKVGPEHPRIF